MKQVRTWSAAVSLPTYMASTKEAKGSAVRLKKAGMATFPISLSSFLHITVASSCETVSSVLGPEAVVSGETEDESCKNEVATCNFTPSLIGVGRNASYSRINRAKISKHSCHFVACNTIYGFSRNL